MKIRTLSLFSGIGAFEKALERQGIEHEIVAYCEIDKYASKSYSAIHSVPESMNLGDITKVDPKALPDFDLLTWGFPCQDISIAGHLKGIVEGETRSGLYYEGFRILKQKMPKYSIIENVKNLVGKRFRADFDSMLDDIESLGYNNYWQVLNAKDYGIPQNRERVFIVSIRKDVDNGNFVFPEKEPLELRLKDMLEGEVDEKYYLSKAVVDKLSLSNIKETGIVGYKVKSKETDVAMTLLARDYKGMSNQGINVVATLDIKGHDCIKRVYNDNGLSPTITNMQGGNRQPKIQVREATKKGYAEAGLGDSINIGQPNSKTRRGRDGKHIANTLTTQQEMAVVEPNVLTPKRTEYGKAIRKQYEAGEISESRHNMTEMMPREDGITNALTTVQKDNYVVEPICLNPKGRRGGIDGLQPSLQDGVYDSEGISVALTTGFMPSFTEPTACERRLDEGLRFFKDGCIGTMRTIDSCGDKRVLYPDYRIRKLTPKECWRLMGFDDADIENAMAAGISNSQLYKQAGNSIVVNVLEAIFIQLLKGGSNE